MEGEYKLQNKSIKFEVDHRDVKYPRIEFKTGQLVLVMPNGDTDYLDVIGKHKKWILGRSSIIEDALEDSKSKSLEGKDDRELRRFVYTNVEKISKELNLDINKIIFRKMRSKWGSMSVNKNLTINTILKYLPNNLVEYVLYHEIAHLKERRHNENFWRIISKKFKDYENNERELLVYWFLIQEEEKEDNI